MTTLDKKTAKAKKVISRAIDIWDNSLAIAWTGGKDSTVMLHLVKEIRGKIDLPVIYLNTQLDAPEIHNFMDNLAKSWNFPIKKYTNPKGLTKYKRAVDIKEKSLTAAKMKISALKVAVKNQKFPALLVAIRADEHKERSKETHFSKRDTHTRVHPLLNFTETDIWDYIYKFKVPYNPLYDQGYRSLGEQELTRKVTNSKAPERAGRDQSKEKVMGRLRALGYF